MDVCTNPECRDLREQLERLKSTGYDMLKQRGSWQSHGATHAELNVQFMEFFDDEVYEIVEDENLQGNEDTAREMLCKAFQEMFDSCREHILSKMQNELQKVVSLEDISGTKDSEAAYDATRAYSLLLHATGLGSSYKPEDLSKENCQQTLSEKVPHLSKPQIDDFADKAATLSWNLLTTIPPLVSAQPKGEVNKKWHEIYSDSWDKSCRDNYELVYYRPVLYSSDGNGATEKGFVGNRKCIEPQCIQKQPQPASENNDSKNHPQKKQPNMAGPTTTHDNLCPAPTKNEPIMHYASSCSDLHNVYKPVQHARPQWEKSAPGKNEPTMHVRHASSCRDLHNYTPLQREKSAPSKSEPTMYMRHASSCKDLHNYTPLQREKPAPSKSESGLFIASSCKDLRTTKPPCSQNEPTMNHASSLTHRYLNSYTPNVLCLNGNSKDTIKRSQSVSNVCHGSRSKQEVSQNWQEKSRHSHEGLPNTVKPILTPKVESDEIKKFRQRVSHPCTLKKPNQMRPPNPKASSTHVKAPEPRRKRAYPSQSVPSYDHRRSVSPSFDASWPDVKVRIVPLELHQFPPDYTDGLNVYSYWS